MWDDGWPPFLCWPQIGPLNPYYTALALHTPKSSHAARYGGAALAIYLRDYLERSRLFILKAAQLGAFACPRLYAPVQ